MGQLIFDLISLNLEKFKMHLEIEYCVMGLRLLPVCVLMFMRANACVRRKL